VNRLVLLLSAADTGGVRSNNPSEDLTSSMRTFGRATPRLLGQEVLEFVHEEVRVPGRFREHTHTKLLELKILDDAGTCVGWVSEEPPLGNATFKHTASIWSRPVRAAVYASDGRRVLEFSASNGVRRFLGRSLEWGRRLDIADGAGERVGTLLVGEFRLRAPLYGRSGERIGRVVKASRAFLDYGILDSRDKELGWIGDSAALARRLEPDAPRRTRIKQWWTTTVTPSHHFLAIASDVDPDLRVMMLAASAAFHLVLSDFSRPHE
jgi:hypothetical protein